MKKVVIAIVCFLSVAYFASCNKQPVSDNSVPTIAFLNGENLTYQDVNLTNVKELSFGITAFSNEETNMKLSHFHLYCNDIVLVDSANLATTSFNYTFSETFNKSGKYAIVAKIYDEAGKVATTSLNVTIHIEPTIDFIHRVGYTFDDAEIGTGSNLLFEAKAASNDNTGENLSRFVFLHEEILKDINDKDSIVLLHADTIENIGATEYIYEYSYLFDSTGNYIITTTVYDELGESASKSINITVDAALEIEETTWVNMTTDTITGIDWFKNDTTLAYIRPESKVSLYAFDENVWDKVTTELTKKNAFSQAESFGSLDDYMISIENPENELGQVIGTKTSDGGYHLIRLIKSTVEDTNLSIYVEIK